MKPDHYSPVLTAGLTQVLHLPVFEHDDTSTINMGVVAKYQQKSKSIITQIVHVPPEKGRLAMLTKSTKLLGRINTWSNRILGENILNIAIVIISFIAIATTIRP